MQYTLHEIALFLIAGSFVFTLRSYNIERSFDIFIDEITYFKISDVIRTTGQVRLYGEPFHLHPPGFFYLQALFLQIADPAKNLIDQVYTARYLNLILAALTGVALYRIGVDTSGQVWGLWALAIFAIDPFIIRMNSRNLLDTAALCWVTVGYWCLVVGLEHDESDVPLYLKILTGIFFGLALLTKDMTAFLTLLPLGAMFITGWFLPRATTFFMGTLTVLIYSIYPIMTILNGEWSYFYEDKLSGLGRLIGLNKETGLNRAAGPSLVDKIFGKFLEFGITYVLIGVGVFAIIILLLWGKRHQQILAFWSAGAYGMLGYAILFGSLEEQFFYFLIVPCVMTVAMAMEVALHTPHRYLRYLIDTGVVVFGVLLFATSAQEWVVRHFTPDNGYERVLYYLQKNIPAKGQIASSSETGQFLLGSYASGPWGEWTTVEELEQYNPEFVMVSYDQVEWDYGELAEEMLDWVETNGQLVFEFNSRTNNLAIFYLNPP